MYLQSLKIDISKMIWVRVIRKLKISKKYLYNHKDRLV